jgi:membrane protein required for colicin V production
VNWLDIVIIAGLAWFTFTGLTAGLLREIATMVGVILGVIVAGQCYTDLAEKLVFISDGNTAKIVAFLIIFLAIVIAAHLLARLLRRVASLLLLGWVDRLGGALFGFGKAFVLAEVALIVFAKFPFLGMEGTINQSRIAPVFLSYLPFLLGLLPPEFDAVRQFLQ